MYLLAPIWPSHSQCSRYIHTNENRDCCSGRRRGVRVSVPICIPKSRVWRYTVGGGAQRAIVHTYTYTRTHTQTYAHTCTPNYLYNIYRRTSASAAGRWQMSTDFFLPRPAVKRRSPGPSDRCSPRNFLPRVPLTYTLRTYIYIIYSYSYARTRNDREVG